MKDIFSLKGKVALVTGGFGNLGPYFVKSLLISGAQVAVFELNVKDRPPLYDGFPKNNYRIYKADVTQKNTLQRIHLEIKKNFGLISILVNNAGIDVPPDKNNLQTRSQEDTYLKMWQVNVLGIVNCIEEFSSDIKKKGGGSIINIGSLYLERSPDEKLYDHLKFDKPWAYGATKAAVDQVTRHYASRLAKYNIRVNTLSPGGIEGGQDKEFINKFCQKVPLGRMGRREKDLTGPLIFLASNASGYVTGINLQVNGGYTVW